MGAMIGPEGYMHRWTAARSKFVRVCSTVSDSSMSLVERLVGYTIHAPLVLGLSAFWTTFQA